MSSFRVAWRVASVSTVTEFGNAPGTWSSNRSAVSWAPRLFGSTPDREFAVLLEVEFRTFGVGEGLEAESAD